MAKKYFIIFSMLSAFILGIVFSPEKVQAEELDSCAELVCEWVEQYYRNMDLDETYDISCCFSEDILPLLEAKIEMGAFRRQTLELQYKDYNITVHPISQEESETEANMRLQVKREWYYNENSGPSGITEVLEVTARLDESGEWKITGCYDEFESLIYGPIDELYRNAQAARGTTDISDLPGAYAYTGDIAQKHNGGTWRHSMIVTKFSGGQVYVTGRTSPYSNNDDILVRELHIPANKIGMPSAMPL